MFLNSVEEGFSDVGLEIFAVLGVKVDEVSQFFYFFSWVR